MDPKNRNALCLYSECLMSLGKMDAARQCIDGCIASNPDFKRAVLIRGKLLMSDSFKSYVKVSLSAC